MHGLGDLMTAASLKLKHVYPPASNPAVDPPGDMAARLAEVEARTQALESFRVYADGFLGTGVEIRTDLMYRMQRVETGLIAARGERAMYMEALGVLRDDLDTMRSAVGELVEQLGMVGDSVDDIEEWRMRVLVALSRFDQVVAAFVPSESRRARRDDPSPAT